MDPKNNSQPTAPTIDPTKPTATEGEEILGGDVNAVENNRGPSSLPKTEVTPLVSSDPTQGATGISNLAWEYAHKIVDPMKELCLKHVGFVVPQKYQEDLRHYAQLIQDALNAVSTHPPTTDGPSDTEMLDWIQNPERKWRCGNEKYSIHIDIPHWQSVRGFIRAAMRSANNGGQEI